jgi:hypothetical protein
MRIKPPGILDVTATITSRHGVEYLSKWYYYPRDDFLEMQSCQVVGLTGKWRAVHPDKVRRDIYETLEQIAAEELPEATAEALAEYADFMYDYERGH